MRTASTRGPRQLIARIAKNLPYEIEVRARGRAARARSTVALMSLGIRGGDEVVIAGFEAAAATGVAAIVDAIRNLEAVAAHAPAPVAVAVPAGSNPRGVIASRGIAVGPAFYLQAAEMVVIEAGQGVDVEQRAFDRARDTVRARLAKLVGDRAAHRARDHDGTPRAARRSADRGHRAKIHGRRQERGIRVALELARVR